MMADFVLLASPLGHGRFMACLGERVILESSRQPLLDAARFLLGEGVTPDTRIAMRHQGSPHVALSSTVGKAAKLEVKDDLDYRRAEVCPVLRAPSGPAKRLARAF